MSKQFNDDEIISLYAQNNNELPPKELDDAILAHAFDAIESEAPSKTRKPKRLWQYSGIAAALIAVVVFAPWQYYQEEALESETEIVKSSQKSLQLQTKKVVQRAPDVEVMEAFNDDVQIEKIEVTGARVELVAPEQKARKVQAAPTMMRAKQGAEPPSAFTTVIEKLDAKDKKGAEDALIKLLEAEPKLHNKVPTSLNDFYLELLDSGKLSKPES